MHPIRNADTEPGAQATGPGQATAATRFGAASPRAVAHFGIVFRLLEAVFPWPVARAPGSVSYVVHCVCRGELDCSRRFFHSPSGALEGSYPGAGLDVAITLKWRGHSTEIRGEL